MGFRDSEDTHLNVIPPVSPQNKNLGGGVIKWSWGYGNVMQCLTSHSQQVIGVLKKIVVFRDARQVAVTTQKTVSCLGSYFMQGYG